MNVKQESQVEEVIDFADVRELTADEVLAVAGGPQVTNDATQPP